MAPNRPIQHEIDAKARSVLANAVSLFASLNQHQEDYGIDYTGELFDGSTSIPSATGIDFQVQLKGAATPRYRSDYISLPFDTDHLKHFLNNKRVPVFLVVVDTTAGTGTYVFLQDYARRCLRKGWHAQATVTVRVPRRNSILNTLQFQQDIKAADLAMSVFRPGAIHGSIAAEKARLEAIDPRVSVEIKATSDGMQVGLIPRESFTWSAQFSGPKQSLKRMVTKLVEKGEPVSLAEYGVTLAFTGMPILATEQVRIKAVQCNREFRGSVRFSLRRRGAEIGALEIDGTWAAGTKATTFRTAPNARVLSGTAQITMLRKGANAVLRFGLDITEWLERDVCGILTDFGRFERAFASMEREDDIWIEFLVNGNSVGSEPLPPEGVAHFRRIAVVTSSIARARHIAKAKGVMLRTGTALTFEDAEQISRAYDLMTGRGITVRVGAGRFVATEPMVDVAVGTVRSARGRLEEARVLCRVLDQEVDFGPGEIEMREAEAVAIDVDRESGAVTWELKPRTEVLRLIEQTGKVSQPST